MAALTKQVAHCLEDAQLKPLLDGVCLASALLPTGGVRCTYLRNVQTVTVASHSKC